MLLNSIHHIAIICSDYAQSKAFYTEKLGLEIVQEVYRAERKSHKLDLKVGEKYQIELFSFPSPPERASKPEACGLRHLAFEVTNVDFVVADLRGKGIDVEPIRTDEWTNKRFTFFADPDGLPIELYEK
jgi:glyoxylase I family protein